MVIQLNVDEECAKGRGGFGEERYEKVEFQRRVRSLYAKLSEENKDVSNQARKEYFLPEFLDVESRRWIWNC